jgi:hypothetical protein
MRSRRRISRVQEGMREQFGESLLGTHSLAALLFHGFIAHNGVWGAVEPKVTVKDSILGPLE